MTDTSKEVVEVRRRVDFALGTPSLALDEISKLRAERDALNAALKDMHEALGFVMAMYDTPIGRRRLRGEYNDAARKYGRVALGKHKEQSC